jgi:hypothetical protein
MKLLLAGGALTAWTASVPILSVLAVLAGPGPTPSPIAASADVQPAIAAARSMVGAPNGWHRKCDRLVCRAYGYANSGYPTAAAHWQAMVDAGRAHPGDPCPPPGSFAFWSTQSGIGHVALVTGSDAYCDPARITLVSNDVLDVQSASAGGIYEVTLARIEAGFVAHERYLGWSDPMCAGIALDPLA